MKKKAYKNLKNRLAEKGVKKFVGLPDWPEDS